VHRGRAGQEFADAALFASDISEAAVNVARRNAARPGVAERIEFRVGDLFAPWEATREGPAEANVSLQRERGPTDDTGAARPGSATARPGSALFDVIVSNPPYVATAPGTPVAENVRKYEPHAALFAGPDGLDVIRRIIAEAPRWLAPNGHLLMEMAFDQAHKVCGLLNSSHWQHVTTYRDAAGYERVVHARRPADAPRLNED
jgi:release factor glutamine methyltransferase